MSVSSTSLSRASIGAAAVLTRLLDDLLGKGEGAPFLADALAEARRTDVPNERADVLVFARAHLVSPLTARVGPRLVTAFLDELGAALDGDDRAPGETTRVSRKTPVSEGSSAPISSTPLRLPRCSILLHLEDRFARAALARALVRAGAAVEAFDPTIDDVMSILERTSFDVAVIDADGSGGDLVLAALARKRPQLPAILLTGVLFAEPVSTAHRRSYLLKSARPAEIIEEVRILLPRG